MDAAILSERLRGQKDDIVKIMEHIGFRSENIRFHNNGKYLTTARIGGDNKAGIVIYPDSLVVLQTTHGRESGNIFTLVMDTLSCSFPEALIRISSWINYKSDIKVTLPFGGFYKAVERDTEDMPIFKTYCEDQLPPPNNLSQQYFLDGVSFKTQQLFGVRLDLANNSIVTPIRGYDGKSLIGAKNRVNDRNCPHDKRFYASLPYPKNQIVYGYALSYVSIIKKNCVIIFESEKSTMQAHSFGIPFVVAVGGHCISKVQARYIKSLGVKKVIVAFDSDICEEEKEFEAKKLITDSFGYQNKVYYLHDKDERFIRKADKVSPSDYGRGVLEKLVTNCLVQVK